MEFFFWDFLEGLGVPLLLVEFTLSKILGIRRHRDAKKSFEMFLVCYFMGYMN